MKKRIALVFVAMICVVTIALSIVGCNASLEKIFASNDAGEITAYSNAKEITAIKGKTLIESSPSGTLAIFTEQTEATVDLLPVNITKYSVYNFETSSFVVEPTDSVIGFIEYFYGYYYIDTITTINDESTTSRSIYDASGSRLYTFDATYDSGELDTNGFYAVGGEYVFFISPYDGSFVEIAATTQRTMTEGYTFASDEYYVISNTESRILDVYSKEDLSFVRSINLSEYRTSNSTIAIMMTSSGKIFMQVTTEIDPHAKNYDVIDTSGNQYTIDSYLINLEKGKITKKNVDYVVDDIYTAADLSAFGFNEDYNLAEIRMIDNNAYVTTDYVIIDKNMNIVAYLDDIYEGATFVLAIASDLYYVEDSNETTILLNGDGEVISYDVDIQSDIIVKGNSYYDLSGQLLYTVPVEAEILGTVAGGVITAEYQTIGDLTTLVYNKNGDTLVITDLSLTVMADCFYTQELLIDETDYSQTLSIEFYDGTGTKLFTHISDDVYETPTIAVYGDGYCIVNIGTSYYKFS